MICDERERERELLFISSAPCKACVSIMKRKNSFFLYTFFEHTPPQSNTRLLDRTHASAGARARARASIKKIDRDDEEKNEKEKKR